MDSEWGVCAILDMYGMVCAVWGMVILAWGMLYGEPAMWGVVGMGNAPSRKCANRGELLLKGSMKICFIRIK